MFSNPNFFSILCLGWGLITLTYAFVNFFLGKKSAEWSLKTFAAEKRPLWMTIISVLYLVLVVYTWYAVATMNVDKSWLIAVLFSLGVIKIYFILFDYEAFRQLCIEFLSKSTTVALLNIFVVIFSALLVFMGVFYYS